MELKQLVENVVNAMEDKKANDIKILDISEVSVMADYFVIASGTNRNQVQSIAENVEESLNKNGIYARQIEGFQTANWILMDFNDIIVHVFNEEDRLFYNLEKIWLDGKEINKNEFMSH